jgi:hypothetical protein
MKVLQEIMARWPGKDDNSDDESFKERLSGYLADEFDFSNLTIRPDGTFSIFSKALLIGKIAKILVFDSKWPDYPRLAIMQKTDDGRWLLKAFVFQCLSCFGTGVLAPEEPCGACGATGWWPADYVDGITAV